MTEQQALQHTTPQIRKHWETYRYMPDGYNKYEVGQMVWNSFYEELQIITKIVAPLFAIM